MSTKKQVGFRLDEELVACLESLSQKYPKLSLTDVADMAIKSFFYSLNTQVQAHKFSWLDETVGAYMRGEFDEVVRILLKHELKPSRSQK